MHTGGSNEHMQRPHSISNQLLNDWKIDGRGWGVGRKRVEGQIAVAAAASTAATVPTGTAL